ncbi:UNKNOWN [Stylonychia lemnae]|uniref:Uncharacterized protein n=1 Tax=Stylonychia lemnae TaxID=5949 RepID=A0A077ZR41_STYLE|nr:UNKNOWN [Stylonychia lemnae]|eukprot:CDW71924.1 UNKNOWN [Stylonychia lemnae]
MSTNLQVRLSILQSRKHKMLINHFKQYQISKQADSLLDRDKLPHQVDNLILRSLRTKQKGQFLLIKIQARSNKQVAEVYSQGLIKSKGQINGRDQQSNGNQHRGLRRHHELSSKLKLAGAASLQREPRESSLKNGINISHEPPTLNSHINTLPLSSGIIQKQGLIGTSNGANSHLNANNGYNINLHNAPRIILSGNDSPLNRQNGSQSNNQITLTSSRNNPGAGQQSNAPTTTHQQQINQQRLGDQLPIQKLNKNQSRNNMDHRQSISFEGQQQQQPQSQNQNQSLKDSLLQKEKDSGVRNPYLASAKGQLKNNKAQQKLREKSLNVFQSNQSSNTNTNNNSLNKNQKPPIYQESSNHKTSSSKASPKSRINNGQDSHTISGNIQSSSIQKPTEKGLQRNNSVFSRRDLIKQEYDRIIENRLPNIINLINQDKHSLQNPSKENNNNKSFSNEIMEYDDTELFSQIFSKEKLTKHILFHQPYMGGSLLTEAPTHSLHDQNSNPNTQGKIRPPQPHMTSSQSQDRIYGQQQISNHESNQQAVQNRARKARIDQPITNNSHNTNSNGQDSMRQRKLSVELNKHVDMLNNIKVGIPEYEENGNKNSKHDRFNSNNKIKDDSKSTASGIKDVEIERLDKLQLINASARYELLSVNQQLLDFHLNRIVNKKFKGKKNLQINGDKAVHSLNKSSIQIQQLEKTPKENDIDERNSDAYNSELSLSFQESSDRNKMDRIKQLAAPHAIMQDRLNSMNPLTFGDTIRLPNVLTFNEN